jgi:HlyD family secretion protein
MAGTEMMRIANFNSMEVQVEVSENDILRVSVGDTCVIEVDAYLEDKFEGVVTEIANSAANTGTGAQVALTSDQVTNFIVKIRISPESYLHLLKSTGSIPFRPGMSATVDIFTETAKDVLTVPIASVTTREEEEKKKDDGPAQQEGLEEEPQQKVNYEVIQEIVFVYEADTAKQVKVETGIQDNEHIQILSGLQEGDDVVAGPYSAISRTIKSGSRLTMKKAEDDEDKKK